MSVPVGGELAVKMQTGGRVRSSRCADDLVGRAIKLKGLKIGYGWVRGVDGESKGHDPSVL